MISLFGPPPTNLLKRGENAAHYFTAEGAKPFPSAIFPRNLVLANFESRNIIAERREGFKRVYPRESLGVIDWRRQETLSEFCEENAKVDARRPSDSGRTAPRSMVD